MGDYVSPERNTVIAWHANTNRNLEKRWKNACNLQWISQIATAE